MLKSSLRALRKAIAGTAPLPETASTWSAYSKQCHYEPASREDKHAFVTAALAEFSGRRILDLGANDGEYSKIAARLGNQVVACDIDATAANRLWDDAKRESLPILPLVLNVANPTPATGWGNRECRSFLERAEGQFDCVLMLALLHHLTVTERVPVPLVLDLAHRLTRSSVVIEWVSPEDPFYQSLVRGREELHAGDSRESFEAACRSRFDIVRSAPVLGGRRWLYLLAKR